MFRLSLLSLLLLALSGAVFAAERGLPDAGEIRQRGKKQLAELQPVGAAKVGDGSPVARAWADYPRVVQAAEKARQAEDDRRMREAFGGDNPFKNSPFSSSIGGSGEVRSAAVGSLPKYATQPDPIHWVVQLRLKNPNTGSSNISGYRIPAGDGQYCFMARTDGVTSTGWLGIGRITDSSIPRYEPADVLKEDLQKLARSEHPLTPQQQADVEALLKAHNPGAIVEAWKKLEADLSNAAAVRAFVEAWFLHSDDNTVTVRGFDALLTPQQRRVVRGNSGPSTSTFSYGGPNGKISGTRVRANDSVTLTLTLQDMVLSKAVESVVERVNEEFEVALSAPAVDPSVAGKRISCKIVLNAADTALAKLANAAGCVLVDGPKGATLKAR